MKCNYCEWQCELSKGLGICNRYIEKDGKIVECEPFSWIDFYPYSIECMPFYHVLPNENVIQTGTVSCNAQCNYCINSHLAINMNDKRVLKYRTPEQILFLIRQLDAKAIVFALNEITCYLPSAIAVADLLHENGYKVGCLTNGFQTEATAVILANKMDFINVSLKSLSDNFYKENLGLSSVNPVIRNIQIFNEKTHLEIVTPLVHEIVHDGIYSIMEFIYSVNPEIVWHLFKLMPNYKRVNEPEVAYEEMLKIYENVKKKIPYTYLGNFSGSRWINTYCPKCGELLIERISTGAWLGETIVNNLKDDCCPKCKKQIPGVF